MKENAILNRKETEQESYKKIRYEREGFQNYMVLEPCTEINPFEIKMIRRHAQLGLLSVQVKNCALYYEIQGMQKLSDWLQQQTITDAEMIQMLSGMIQDLKQMEAFMLLADSVVLQPDLLYISHDKQRVGMCYISGYQGNIQWEFRQLVEYLMTRIDHRQEQLVILIYGIYHIIKDENYNMQEVEDFIQLKAQVTPENPEETMVEPVANRMPEEEIIISEEQAEQNAKMQIEPEWGWETHTGAEPEKTDVNITRQLMKRQLFRARQQVILYATGCMVMLLFTGYIAEETVVRRAISGYHIMYACFVVLAGFAGALLVQIRKARKLRFLKK